MKNTFLALGFLVSPLLFTNPASAYGPLSGGGTSGTTFEVICEIQKGPARNNFSVVATNVVGRSKGVYVDRTSGSDKVTELNCNRVNQGKLVYQCTEVGAAEGLSTEIYFSMNGNMIANVSSSGFAGQKTAIDKLSCQPTVNFK